jgi:hypothetical protein
MVELALLLPILISLFLGTWFFGYSNYLYAELEQAVRSGARYASHGVYQTTAPSAYVNAVRNAVVYGDPMGGTRPVVPDLRPEMVQVSLSPPVGTPISVRVSISGFKDWGPFGTPILLCNKPSLEMPFMGYYVPL